MKQNKIITKLFANSTLIISMSLCVLLLLIIYFIPNDQLSIETKTIICLAAMAISLILPGLAMVVRREYPYVNFLNGIPAILIGSILIFFGACLLLIIIIGVTR